MIVHPQKQDIEQMKRIWELCFGDDRQTVDDFYDTCFSSDECFISRENDTVQAVAHLIKCSVVVGEQEFDSRYMYAICTHPDYQGRGIMSELINKALENEKSNGTKLVLCIPADEKLFGFYRRLGFVDGIYCSEHKYKREFIESNCCENDYKMNLSAFEFNCKRTFFLKNNRRAFVSFPDRYIKLAERFGYSSVITDNSYALFTNADGITRITDCFWRENGFEELCFVLKNETDTDEYVFESVNGDDTVLKGVVKVFDDSLRLNEKIYLGINLE